MVDLILIHNLFEVQLISFDKVIKNNFTNFVTSFLCVSVCVGGKGGSKQ